MHQTGPAHGCDLGRPEAELGTGVRRQLRHGSGVPEHVRRLEVDEVGHGTQCHVEAVRREPDAQCGLGSDDRIPGLGRLEVGEDHVRLVAQKGGEVRVELRPRPLAGELHGGVESTHPLRHLRVLGDLGDPGGQRDIGPLQVARPAATVPALIRSTHRLLDRIGQTELMSQRARQGRVTGDHAVEIPVTRHGELEADPEPVQRRVARADKAHGRGRAGHAALLVVVLARLERNVVAEPLGLLVRVGMAADVDEQRGVVDDEALIVVQPNAFPDAQRDQALAKDVLHRLAEAQIDPQRQGRHELGEADGRRLLHLHGAHADDAIPRFPWGHRLSGETHTQPAGRHAKDEAGAPCRSPSGSLTWHLLIRSREAM